MWGILLIMLDGIDGYPSEDVDLTSQIDWTLSLTPTQRLEMHDAFLELVLVLREAGIKLHGRDLGSSQETD